MQFNLSLAALVLLTVFSASAAALIALKVDNRKWPAAKIVMDKLLQASLIGIAALASLLTSLAARGI